MENISEEKVRAYWESSKVFQANPSEKEKVFITAAFPYPNSPQHIGHARTYTITDIYARYNRLIGKNVLFPMGFHVTGTPIIAMAKRIEEGDEDLLKIFEEIYGIPKEKAKSLTNPKDLVLYFSKEIEEGMKLLGLSIDWRRKFYTFDPHFNKFIEWQFLKLKEAGFIEKGEHPIPWSVKLNSPIGAHDTKGDVDPEIEEITGIKFEFGDSYLVAATYRPETIFGVTNLWINEEEQYVKVRIKGENYIFSKKAYEKLSHQLEGEILESFGGSYLLNKKAKHPLSKKEIPILPASFVKGGEGTGIVMSVPGHAPYDYVALRDLGKLEELKPLKIISSSLSVEEVVEKLGIKEQTSPKLEEATKLIYKEEAHKGKMLIESYKGMLVKEAKEKVKEDLIKEGKAIRIWVIANSPVYTRAGDEVVVKLVKDQWFINYGNPSWKARVREHFEKMKIIPPSLKKQFLETVEWLERKACTRSSGLGTRFPFDKSKMIEALSDSTIYMAFYTISHKIKEFSPKELDEAFFDYLFLGKGTPKNALHKSLREEFLYWYPLDSRHSGADLVRNHLTFFVFNHIAIFPKELWPKQIVVNGFVLMEGKKMSKSLGNILPLKEAIKKYGADAIRISVAGTSDLLQDSDFYRSVAEGVKQRLSFFKNLPKSHPKLENSEKEKIDLWLESKLNRKIKGVFKKYEEFQLREIILELFYEMYEEIKWYLQRVKTPKLREFLKKWSLALSPFIPYTAEAIWFELEGKGIEGEKLSWEEEKINLDREKAEEVIKAILLDVENIRKLANKKGEKLTICLALDWKFDFLSLLSKEKNMEKIQQKIKEGEKHLIGEKLKLLSKLRKELHKIESPPSKEILKEHLEDAKEFLEKQLQLKVEIVEEETLTHPKAKQSLPTKPALILE